MILTNFNIDVSCAANLVFWETILSERLVEWLIENGCACFSCLSKWLAGNIVGRAVSS